MIGENVVISGKDIIYTDEAGKAYRVTDGHVMVFIVPKRDGIWGRRHFICESDVGTCIPAFTCDGFYQEAEDICQWAFAVLPSPESTLMVVEDSNEIREEFAKNASLKDYEQLGFDESILEFYRINLMREARNLFATEKVSENAANQSMKSMFSLFRRENKTTRTKNGKQLTGNTLYDAAVHLCTWQYINVEAIDAIRVTCGNKFTLRDFARLSGFVCRDIILDETWYLKDIGPIFAYYGKKSVPVSCIPKKGGKYYLWNPETDEEVIVTKDIAKDLNPRAMMFYRPFPNKSMGLRDIISFALKDLQARDVSMVLILALAGTIIGLLIPYLNEQLYDLFIPLGDTSGLYSVCMVVLACTLGNLSFSVVKNLADFRAINRMKYAVQAAVFDRLFNLPESFFRGYDSAELGKYAMGISDIFQTIASTTVDIGISALFSLFYLWRMFGYSKMLSWVSITLLAIVMAIIAFLGWKQLNYERQKFELNGKVSSLLFQLIGGISKIRIAGAEERGLNQYVDLYTDIYKIELKRVWYDHAASIIGVAADTVFSIALFYMMIRNQLNLSVGVFMGFSTAFSLFSSAMMTLVNSWLTVNDVLPAFDKMKPILETLPEIQENAILPGELEGEIELNNVIFGYDSERKPVLDDISMHIIPGEYVGIVGPSGCGKSTLLKLLLGFEKPQSGKIYYDGQDIETLDKREMRKRFGVVLQDGGLVTGTIYDNIVITSPGAKSDQVNQAIKEAGIENDIAEMPMGINTMLSEGDGSISGGQKQRILIARAIVGRPKILFFDEATSALDNDTQAVVCESLDELHSTRIVIAHRLSTIMNCDRILVMDDGHIVEEGDFENLMEKKGIFYSLASRQMS